MDDDFRKRLALRRLNLAVALATGVKQTVNMVVAKVWKLVRRPEGKPRVEDFALVEEEMPALGEGDVLVEAVALSVDPYLRYRSRVLPLNSVMFGSQVAKVIESRNPQWPVGKHFILYEGWRTHTVLRAHQFQEKNLQLQPLPEMGDLPKSLGIGLLGMPGNTAYFGLLELGQPKAGDTVLVNAAAGAVGSAVVQIAKIKGCTVIAFAGSDEKVKWVKELGADHAFNYKTTKVGEALTQAAPNGINVYFDNVGGKFTAEALHHMAEFGRVPLCGAISTYNDETKVAPDALTGAFKERVVLTKQLRVEGFIVTRWGARWMEGLNQLKEWVLEGKLKYRETVVHGFEKMPQAFIGLFDGDNIGKAVVVPE